MIIFLITLLQIAIIVVIIKAYKSPEFKEKVSKMMGSKTVRKSKDVAENVKDNIIDNYRQVKDTFTDKDYEMINLSVDTAMDMDDEVYREYNFNDVNKDKNNNRYGVVKNEPTTDYKLDDSNVVTFNDTSASKRYSDSIYTDNYMIREKKEPDQESLEINFDSDEIELK